MSLADLASNPLGSGTSAGALYFSPNGAAKLLTLIKRCRIWRQNKMPTTSRP
jgi:hypothetical protein